MLFKKTKTKKRFKKQLNLFQFEVSSEVKTGVLVTVLLFCGIILAFSFVGQAGMVGEIINTGFSLVLASAKWVLVLLIILLLVSLGVSDKDDLDSANLWGLFLFLFSSIGLWSFFDSGVELANSWVPDMIFYLGDYASALLLSSILIISIVLTSSMSLERMVGPESLLVGFVKAVLIIVSKPFVRSEYWDMDNDEEEKPLVLADTPPRGGRIESKDASQLSAEKGFKKQKTVIKEYRPLMSDVTKGKWNLNIPLDLLNSKHKKPESGDIGRNQEIIKSTLADFGIPVSMGEVRVGPTVTQYTLKPERGVSVTRLRPLQDDLALSLATHPVRLEAPIPGKSLVGIEIPNQTKVVVTLKEILKTNNFKNSNSSLTLPLGRDIAGDIWIDDLARMPHLLIAGATGSGKSVGLHSFILSLMYQNSPEQLKFILIDVKQVELSKYDGLPYLIAPVVIDTKRAIRALNWSVSEMEKRLETLKEANCQNIAEYNRKKKKKMPYLVIAVDELGDLLCTAKREAESSIIRLGQKARAAGIHLILATQRPSVDVVSGLIKANMPARMAFSVTSGGNSKTILDFNGAEKLLGQGDMLYINSTLSKPVRIQGAYVSKEEIKAVTNYIKKKTGPAKFKEDILGGGQTQIDLDSSGSDFQDTELKQQAIALIERYQKASATMLQSRLSIGYPRANRLLDELEKKGIVGPSVQNKPREVYL